MRYVHIENPGLESRLTILDGPNPQYTDTQILVRARATALNRADLMQRYGRYPPPAGESNIPGLEVAGDVIAVGCKVSEFKPGDRVYGLVGSGAYAQFCAVEASLAQHIPPNWNYSLAAALPESLTTAYASLFDLGELKSGQSLLIHGAGSGISSLAIQMAKLSGARVITTVGHEHKVEQALQLGADQVINHKNQKIEHLIKEQSIELIIDFIGGDYFNKHLDLLKPKSKLIQIACLKAKVVECNLMLIIHKRLEIIGFILRSQSIEEKSKLWKAAHSMWLDSLRKKQLRPIIDSQFILEHIEEAQQYMQSGTHFGKIVIYIN